MKLSSIVCHQPSNFELCPYIQQRKVCTKMPNMHLVSSCFVTRGRSLLLRESFIEKQKIDFSKWRLAAKYFKLFYSFYFMLLKTKELKRVGRIFQLGQDQCYDRYFPHIKLLFKAEKKTTIIREPNVILIYFLKFPNICNQINVKDSQALSKISLNLSFSLNQNTFLTKMCFHGCFL